MEWKNEHDGDFSFSGAHILRFWAGAGSKGHKLTSGTCMGKLAARMLIVGLLNIGKGTGVLEKKNNIVSGKTLRIAPRFYNDIEVPCTQV